MFTSTIRMGKKCDLCDFDRSMIVGARLAGLNISVPAHLLEFLCTQQSQEFTQNGVKNKKHPVKCFNVRGQRRRARLSTQHLKP